MTDFARRIVHSYRFRILLGYGIIVSLVAGAWAWTLFGPLTRTVIDQQQSQLESVAHAGSLAIGSTRMPLSTFVRQLTAGSDLRVTVIAADGRVLADNQQDPARMENHRNRPEVRAALAGRVGRDTRLSHTQSTRETYVAVPAMLQGKPAVLRVSESLARIEGIAGDARRVGLLLLLASIVVSMFVTGRLAERAAAPVLRLADAAHAMSQGDLSTRIVHEPGELGVLSSALADLRRQLRSRLSTLEQERSSLRSVLDGLSDTVFLVEDSRIDVANRAASAMFRTPSGGWQGRSLVDSVLPASVVAAVSRLAKLGGGEEEISDPTQRYLRVAVTVLSVDDEHPRLLIVISDVTERSQLDNVRRDFVANASHELKTPTAAIHLLAESAKTAAEDGNEQQALAFVSQIEGESARLQRLVRDLLDLSRLEARPSPGSITDVRAAIELAVTAHRRAASSKGLSLRTDLSLVAGRDIYAAADPTDVAVLLDNLVDNAVKYTERGTVTIRLRADGDTIDLTVSDTGIGIPAEHLPRVFERFYRVDRARSRESGGTGLGLALVKHVVEQSSGKIAIASREGEGTEIHVSLQLAS